MSVFPIEIGDVVFLSIAAVMFIVVAVGLRTGKTLGIAFRSRFIATREREPVLYWASLLIFAVFGALAAFVIVYVRLTSF